MEFGKFWGAAIKATGSVGVVGFLLWFVLNKFFEKDVLQLFDSQEIFQVFLLVFCCLIIALLAGIRVSGGEKGKFTKGRNVTVSKSTLKGDFIMGDKNINQGHPDE